MAVLPTAAHAGPYFRTFTVTGAAGDAATDSVATAHGLTQAPIDYWVVDTTPAGAPATVTGNVWAVHTVGATTFVVRKTIATAEARTALVVMRDPHSIDR